MTHCFSSWLLFFYFFVLFFVFLVVSSQPAGGVPNEIRTRVTAVKGRCPKPLDDGNNLFPFFFYFFVCFSFCFSFRFLFFLLSLLLYSTDSRRIDIANICFAFLNFSKTLDCFFELFLSAFLNF